MVPGILRRNETGDVFARGVVEVVTQECVLRPIIDQLIKSPCGTTAGRALYLAARANRDTPRECPAERTTVRLTEVKMAPDSGLKVSLAKGSATPGDVLGFRVLRAATATINRNGTVARAQEVWSGEARIQSDTAMALYAIVARGARLDPDPERPFLLVETTSKPSGGPVSCEQPLQEWKDDHKEPTLNGLHGPYKSVAKAMTDDAALPFAYARTHCDVYEWGFAIMRKNTHDRGYYTTPPIRGPEPGTPISAASVPWSDYKRSIDTAFSNSCETVRDFSIAALVHTPPFGVLASDRFTPQDYEHAKELNNGRGTAYPRAKQAPRRTPVRW